MAAPAGWSELPKELLHLISQRLDIEIDLLRFRSVCSNWRSSSIPNHHQILPFEFPLQLKFPNDTFFCQLSKQNFFLIKPPPQQQTLTLIRPWLIRISKNSTGKTQLFNPNPYPFPHVLDSDKLSVVPLGNNFIKEYDFTKDCKYIYPEKVVSVTCHGKQPIVLGTLFVSPQPLILKCGDENWNIVPDMSVYSGDICVFKGRAYAVDRIGKTVRVGLDDSSDSSVSSVQLVAEPLVGGGGFRKFLVESEGELLLVDVYDCTLFGFADHFPVWIDLFKLDEKEKKWLKLTSLGDRVLFLGFVCSFTVSISDLCVTKGNCVIFMDNILKWFTYFDAASCVFDLDEGRLSPLSDYPEYDVFMPPEWIINS